MPLSQSDRAIVAEARKLGNANSPRAMLAVLASLGSPLTNTPDQGAIFAATLGQAQALCAHMADRIEALAAEADKARAEADGPLWAVWYVNEAEERAREVTHAHHEAAVIMTGQLNTDAPRGVHYVALPFGGLPFDEAAEAEDAHPDDCGCAGHGVCRYWNTVPQGARAE